MTETFKELAQYQTDHDLLILLNERVRLLTESVDGKTTDHEIRIRTLEEQRWIVVGGLGMLSFIAPFILHYIFHLF